MALTPAKSNVWVDRAFSGANLGIVVAIAYLSVKLFYLFLEPGSAVAPPELFGQTAGPSQKAHSNAIASVDPSAIPLWNLFGREGENKVAATTPTNVDAPKTSLQLELQGVFVALKEENSTAIIAERMRDANLYHIGDKLPGNASLAGVFPDRVLLNTQGRTEALYFPDSGGGAPGAGSGVFSPMNGVRNGGPGGPPSGMSSLTSGGGAVGNAPVPQGNFGLGGEGMPEPEEMAKAIREELGSNPQQAMREMGLEMNGGNGYRVSGAGSQMFSALGLRPGAIIHSINGRSLGNPDSDVNLIEEFGKAKSISVDAEINGKRVTLEVPMQ